jgi:hypothetical protein
MATSHLEQCRVYVAANGGYAAVAASIGLTPVHMADVLLGRRRPSSVFAAGMAPLIGSTLGLIKNADPDRQLLARSGVL